MSSRRGFLADTPAFHFSSDPDKTGQDMPFKEVYRRPASVTIRGWLAAIGVSLFGVMIVLGGLVPALLAGKIFEASIVAMFGGLMGATGPLFIWLSIESDRAIRSAAVHYREGIGKYGSWHKPPQAGRGKGVRRFEFAFDGADIYESMTLPEAGRVGAFKQFENTIKGGEAPTRIWYVEVEASRRTVMRVEADLP